MTATGKRSRDSFGCGFWQPQSGDGPSQQDPFAALGVGLAQHGVAALPGGVAPSAEAAFVSEVTLSDGATADAPQHAEAFAGTDVVVEERDVLDMGLKVDRVIVYRRLSICYIDVRQYATPPTSLRSEQPRPCLFCRRGSLFATP